MNNLNTFVWKSRRTFFFIFQHNMLSLISCFLICVYVTWSARLHLLIWSMINLVSIEWCKVNCSVIELMGWSLWIPNYSTSVILSAVEGILLNIFLIIWFCRRMLAVLNWVYWILNKFRFCKWYVNIKISLDISLFLFIWSWTI